MENIKVIVGLGSCGIAAGANKVFEKIKALKEADNLKFELKKTSCIGMCYREPLVEIVDDNGSYLYGDINEKKAAELIEKHILKNEPIKSYVVQSDLFETPDKDFIEDQVKITL